MNNGAISIDHILSKLDEYLGKNDYASAERHLLYWLVEAEQNGDSRTELLIRNELMGLYRKLGKKEEAFSSVKAALEKIEALRVSHQVGAATTLLNSATVYKAFGEAEKALPLFTRARDIYEKELSPKDSRLAGLYNNMALALVDLKRFRAANELYQKAIAILNKNEEGDLEVAITYLNMATAAEAELGPIVADKAVEKYLALAETLLNHHEPKDGYYAFVCEKCASVFGYYGNFLFEKELTERARRIYGE